MRPNIFFWLNRYTETSRGYSSLWKSLVRYSLRWKSPSAILQSFDERTTLHFVRAAGRSHFGAIEAAPTHLGCLVNARTERYSVRHAWMFIKYGHQMAPWRNHDASCFRLSWIFINCSHQMAPWRNRDASRFRHAWIFIKYNPQMTPWRHHDALRISDSPCAAIPLEPWCRNRIGKAMRCQQ